MVQKQNEGSPYSSKIWLKSYDDHVKPEIEIEVYTIADMLRRTVQKYPWDSPQSPYDFWCRRQKHIRKP